MRPELKIEIRPYWENGTVSFIDYELRGQRIKASPDIPMFCRYDEAFGGLCPFPEMDYLEAGDDRGALCYREKEITSFNSGMRCFGYFPERAVKEH